jgi:hypothetical protein
MQLSGTSMAAGVVSGTVALLLERRPNLNVRRTKSLLQATASPMFGEGLVVSGTGSLNAAAATEVGTTPKLVFDTRISGEPVQMAGLIFINPTQGSRGSSLGHREPVRNQSIFWGQAKSIFWGQADSIFWGQVDSIFWGQADSIFWGQSDSIFWGQSDSIFWGQSDSIFWGQTSDYPVAWGLTADDSIFWGQSLIGSN